MLSPSFFSSSLLLTETSSLESAWQFFAVGGVFMLAILACSLLSFVVIVLKLLNLSRSRIVPHELAAQVEALDDHTDVMTFSRLTSDFEKGETTLARLGAVAVGKDGGNAEELKEAVQTSAREEVVRMTSGLAVLDVVVTIAPLLGLLGTASGLVVVFKDLGTVDNHVAIAKGIARALSTTIAGVAVAVPSVVAHSFYSRKIEKMSARLEVLLGHLISINRRNGGH
jgi:biopolymer transport protein ExbB